MMSTAHAAGLSLPNLTVPRHDIRTDGFPEGSFGLVRVRAVLMHIADRMAMAALAEPMISAVVMTAGEAARLAARPAAPDFLGCGFASWARAVSRRHR